MRFDKFFESLGPMVAMAVANGGFKCDEDGKYSFNDEQGVPLADLDLSGEIPDTVKLLGGDVVRIVEGEDFTIAVEGDEEAKERMRFKADGGALLILRDRDGWRGGQSATVTITMPAPRKLELLGSGTIHAEALADDAKITVMGSGKIETHDLDIDKLKIKFAGSGIYKASGRVAELAISIAGSGSARLGRLHADDVAVSITGSGEAVFSSDGEVDARIMGSGQVTVRGSARCRVKSFGSGTLVCEPGETIDGDEA